MKQFTKMDILVQLNNLRKVYIFFDNDLKVVGVNCKQFKTELDLFENICRNANLEKGVTDIDNCELVYEDVDCNVGPDPELTKLFHRSWNDAAYNDNFFQVFETIIKKYWISKYLVLSSKSNTFYIIEVPSSVSLEKVEDYISNSMSGDFEFMRIDDDFKIGTTINPIKL